MCLQQVQVKTYLEARHHDHRRPPLYVPSHRSHTEREQSEIYVVFDNGYTAKRVVPEENQQKSPGRQASTNLLVYVLKRPISMLTVADPVAPHARLAGVFFSFDQHGG